MLDPRHLAPHTVARWAADTPDTVAVEMVGGDRLTYRELDRLAHRWADGLERLGVGVGTHVATMVPARPEAQIALLALGWLRAVEVPVNTAHRADLLADALDRADVTHLVVDATLLDRVVEVADRLPQLRRVIVVGDRPEAAPPLPALVTTAELLEGTDGTVVRPGPAVEDVAALLYTSGTTGPSKAVIAPWGLIHSIWSWIPDDALRPGEGLYCALPMFHNSGRSGFCNAMDRGARFVYRDKFSVTSFWSDVRRTACSLAALVGPLTSLVWSQAPAADDADNPLRGAILGPMIPDMAAFEARFGLRVATCYGQTEAGCPLTTGWDHGPTTNCGRRRPDWPFNETRIVDAAGDDVAPGEVGELVVRSAEPGAMNLGYYNQPEATAAAWAGGWFHTGDAFRADGEGWHYFVDRLRDTIRRRGENISSFEVEAAVARHPDVRECAAIGIRTVHGDDEVMVAVVVDDPAAFDAAGLRRWLEPRLPRFMLPRYIEAMTDLPRNQTTLRVRKTDLRARGVGPSTWDAEQAPA